MKYSIYKVTNKINGNEYVGFTSTTPHTRFIGHLSEAKSNTNYKFHNALNKYGKDNFIIDTLYNSNDRDFALNIMEPYFIKTLGTFRSKHGYNMTPGGDAGPACVGKDNGMYSKNHTAESLLLMSANRKGKCTGEDNPSKRPEFRKAQSVRVTGENNPMFGKHHSVESNKNRGISVSKALKGVPKKKVACPQCGQIGGAGNMKRYHFDNCKQLEVTKP